MERAQAGVLLNRAVSADATPIGAGTGPDARFHAFDQLRALAMLTGVLFHAALAYSPLLHRFWPTADAQHSRWVDALVWLPHLVRMPLFFVVAGFFTAALTARRGMDGLLRNRVRRILVPFLVAWPLVHGSVSQLTGWAAQALDQPSPLLLMLREWMAQPDPPALPPSTGHLWFLYYLLLFSVMTWAGRTLGLGALLRRWRALGPHVVALTLPLLVLPGFLGTQAPHPAPESLLPQFWAIALYGPFFALGAALQGQADWLAPLRSRVWPAALLCLLLYAAFLWRLGVDAAHEPWATASWPVAVLESLVAAFGTLACLVAGVRWLDRPNAWMSYLARSAYWVYLTHLPILFALQYLLLDVALAWPWKFVLGVAATLALCVGSYELCVRRTRLAHWVG